MKLTSKSAIALLVLAASTAVFAEEKAPESTLSYNIGAVSDYRFRGVTQTNYGAAVQGGVDYAHASGFYIGTWASNVNWVKDVNGATDGTYELDIYGGYKGELQPGLAYDVGYITYMYPGNNSGAAGTPGASKYSNATTKEFYGALTYGVTTLKYSQSLGDFLGNIDSNASRYLDLSATFDVGNGYALTPHIGRQTIPNLVGDVANYTDLSLTLVKDLGNGVTVSAAYVATNADKDFYVNQSSPASDGKYIAKNGALVGVKYAF